MPAILVDTNVLIYAHDPADPVKQPKAIQVLDHLHTHGIGRLTTQALGEFFAATTRGTRPLLTVAKASEQIDNLALSWILFDITPLVVIEAVRGVRVHKLSYGDAQFWATARLNQTPVIFTENFTVGGALEGVRFVNPFGADFVLTDWQ